MQYHKCKCGYSESWESGMPPALCDVCPKCGTTMLKGRDGEYLPSEPHQYITRYNQNTGEPYEVCKKCHNRKTDIEKEIAEQTAPDKDCTDTRC